MLAASTAVDDIWVPRHDASTQSVMIRSAVTGAVAAVLLLIASESATAQQACGDEPVSVQVLGSGGPFAGTDGASSSYLVWHRNRAAVMVDVGGGAFLRFGQAGAPLNDLSLLAISHLHPDHVSDLPALLWVSERARRSPLPISGPSGNEVFPDIQTFIHRLFDRTNGAFPVLAGTLGGQGSGVPVDIRVIDVERDVPSVVLDAEGLRVTAKGVPHTNAPTLAYRVELEGRSIVFSSDQTGKDAAFVDFARGADVLVMHFALSTEAPRRL